MVNILAKTNNKTQQQYYKASFGQKLKDQKYLIAMSAPFVIWVLVFKYAPLAGWLMAFQDYKPAKGIFGSKWVGFKHFITLFKEEQFYQALINTLGMSILAIVFGTLCSITFAILLNEMRGVKYKKLVQTVSYLPHFVSWVVVANIVGQLLSPNGVVNELLVNLHILKQPINFLAVPNMFWGIVTASDIWKETGWNAIIYLAAITSINPELYEAAEIDGAGRFKKMRYVTLPGIKSTICILLIINIGNILNAGFDMQYLLTNGLVQSVSQTIDIYVLKYGISLADYSLATAAGIFKSVISVTLIFIANRIAKAMGEERLF